MADLLTRLIEHEKHMDERIEKFNRSIVQGCFNDIGDLYAFEDNDKEYAKIYFPDDLPIILDKETIYQFLDDVKMEFPLEKEALKAYEKKYSYSFITAINSWDFGMDRGYLLDTLKNWVFRIKEFSEHPEIYKIDIYKSLEEFEGQSLYELILQDDHEDEEYIILPYIIEQGFDLYTDVVRLSENMNIIISRTDMVIYMLRAELGIKSFAEIHDLESMFGYLKYRKKWYWKYEIHTKDKAITLLEEKYRDECYKKNHPISFFEFVSSHGGIQGELWASYDEFYHDEWQDESYRSELS